MRKLIAPALVALFAIVAGMQAPTTAQPLVPAGASGEGLSTKAKSVLSALQTLSPEALFEQLAPWKRNQAELFKARIQQRSDAGKLRWESLERAYIRGKGGLDPAGKLSLSSTEDYVALSPAKLLALHMGLYRAASDSKLSLQLADRWLEVDRAIGLIEPGRGPSGLGSRGVLVQGGQVTLESVGGSRIEVLCATDGHEWYVVSIVAEFGKIGLDLVDALDELEEMGRSRNGVYVDMTAAEGEQMLGSMKGQIRVAFAKTGERPNKMVGAIGGEGKGSGAVQAELEGKYYKIRDAVYGKDWWGAIVAEPLDSGDSWVLMFFSFTGGDGEFLHFETKAQLEAALKDAIDKGWDNDPHKDEK